MTQKLDCPPDVAKMLADTHFKQKMTYHEILDIEWAEMALQRWPAVQGMALTPLKPDLKKS
jgi:hypothetical protein